MASYYLELQCPETCEWGLMCLTGKVRRVIALCPKCNRAFAMRSSIEQMYDDYLPCTMPVKQIMTFCKIVGGVTENTRIPEFYTRFWKKVPILACLRCLRLSYGVTCA